MTYPNASTALARIVVDELRRGGVGLVTAGPGSRSTALVLAADTEIDLVMALDERSAGFHALGWSKATGRPAAVLTTSGTAVANLLPAVVEADASGTPLIVVSADRPPELRNVGANQAIDQRDLFGRFVRAHVDLGPAEPRGDAPRWWRSMVAQALGAAAGFAGRRGPAHLNVAFREPTVPVTDDGRTLGEVFPHDEPGRPDGRSWTETARAAAPPAAVVERLAAAVRDAAAGMIVAGGGVRLGPEVAALGEHLGWPVVATAESGLRSEKGVIGSGHHLVERATPDLIIRLGTPGPSRRMIDLVSARVPQAVVSPTWSDPGRVTDLLIDGDPTLLCSLLMEAVEPREPGPWGRWWQAADASVVAALEPELSAGLSEPAVAFTVGRMASDVVAVASSMPIRDMEAYAFRLPSVVSNRGASGIDGFVSTALGAARPHRRALALSGDLSLLHDSNGFHLDSRPDAVFVTVDNRGGGIFSFLPQAEHVPDSFERLFATPHHRDLALLAAFHQIDHEEVGDVASLVGAVERGWERGGISLVVARTDRRENVAEHHRLAHVVADALSGLPAPVS